MKIINKLKFILKKLTLTEQKYNELIFKSNSYDSMISCIHIDIKEETMDIREGKDNAVVLKYTKAINYICSINIVDMLKAGGFVFDKPIKWNIITKQ